MVRWLFFSFIFLTFSLTTTNVLAANPDNICEIPEDYAVTRPYPEGGPTKVKVSLYLDNLLHIDELKDLITVDFYLKVQWNDERLARASEKVFPQFCRFNLEDLWFPIIIITNQADLKKQYEEWAQVEPDGTVNYIQRFYGTISNKFFLEDFPFDTHWLKIVVGSYFSDEEVEIEAGDFTGQAKEIFMTSWDLLPGKEGIDEKFVPLDQQNHFIFKYEFQVGRKSGYYMWKVVLPLFLIVLMGMSVFWISPIHRVAQLTLSATAFLTLIAFQIRLGDILPPIDYLTRLGQFSLWATVIVFLALIETITVSILAGGGQEELAKRGDKLARYIFPPVFMGVGALLLWV